MTRGESSETKLFTPELGGEFYTGSHLYILDGGYTKINTGFSGFNTPDKRSNNQHQKKTKQERAGRSKESRPIFGRYKGVIVLILVGCNATDISTGYEGDVEVVVKRGPGSNCQ